MNKNESGSLEKASIEPQKKTLDVSVKDESLISVSVEEFLKINGETRFENIQKYIASVVGEGRLLGRGLRICKEWLRNSVD